MASLFFQRFWHSVQIFQNAQFSPIFRDLYRSLLRFVSCIFHPLKNHLSPSLILCDCASFTNSTFHIHCYLEVAHFSIIQSTVSTLVHIMRSSHVSEVLNPLLFTVHGFLFIFLVLNSFEEKVRGF